MSQGNEENFTEVYVTEFHPEFNEKTLQYYFEKHCSTISQTTDNAVNSVILNTEKNGRQSACVKFSNHELATEVIKKLNGKEDPEFCPPGHKAFLTRFEKKENIESKAIDYTDCNLYVKNLDDNVDDNKLKEAFQRFGEITSAKVMLNDKTPKQSKGFGFVCFKDAESANKALKEMNGHLLGRKPLYVNKAQKKEVRRAALETQYSRGIPNVNMLPPQPRMYPQTMYPPPPPGFFPPDPYSSYTNVGGRGMTTTGWPTGFPTTAMPQMPFRGSTIGQRGWPIGRF